MDDPTPPRETDALRALYAPELAPLFWPPARSDLESAWAAYVPFAHWLVAAHRPRSIVELGTQDGVPYLAFCEAAQRTKLDCRCLAIESWEAGEPVLAEFRRVHDLRYGGFSRLLRSTSAAALGAVPDGSIDLLHIGQAQDWEDWRPKLSRRAVVLLDGTKAEERVSQLFAELAAAYPSFEFLHGHGLGVLLVGSERGGAVRGLTFLAGDEARTVRDRFAALGERWRLEMQLASHAAAASARLREVDAALQSLQARAEAFGSRAERLEEEAARAAAERDAQRERTAAAEARHAAQLAALSHALREARAEAAAEHGARTAAEQERDRARARADATEAELRTLSARLAAAWTDAYEQGKRRVEGEAALLAMQSSTVWRLTLPVRLAAGLLPRAARRAARGAVHAAWWAVTFQLGRKLRERRRVLSIIRRSASALCRQDDASSMNA